MEAILSCLNLISDDAFSPYSIPEVFINDHALTDIMVDWTEFNPKTAEGDQFDPPPPHPTPPSPSPCSFLKNIL